MSSDKELYNIIKTNLMTITRGNKGATFIINDGIYNFKLINKGNVVDSTGAGDAFISSIIKDAIKNNFNYDINNLKKWYENLNNKISMYFKQKSTSKYEVELLKYLSDNCVLIESNYDGLLVEFDLLIASQFIIYYIGKILDIDVSKPKYTDADMKIYFYKGNL